MRIGRQGQDGINYGGLNLIVMTNTLGIEPLPYGDQMAFIYSDRQVFHDRSSNPRSGRYFVRPIFLAMALIFS